MSDVTKLHYGVHHGAIRAQATILAVSCLVYSKLRRSASFQVTIRDIPLDHYNTFQAPLVSPGIGRTRVRVAAFLDNGSLMHDTTQCSILTTQVVVLQSIRTALRYVSMLIGSPWRLALLTSCSLVSSGRYSASHACQWVSCLATGF